MALRRTLPNQQVGESRSILPPALTGCNSHQPPRHPRPRGMTASNQLRRRSDRDSSGPPRSRSPLNPHSRPSAVPASGQRSHRCRRCHSEQLSNHLARVNVPDKHLVNQTGPISAQPVFSDLHDPEIESYLAALAAFDASTLSSHLFVPRDIRSSASRFFRSASGSAWRYFCVVWIWW
jgi:hypothetical protein